MDRIEELMRMADPARQAPAPPPFRRADILRRPASDARRRTSRRDHLAVWGAAVGVAAAVGGGLLLAHQWRATPDEPAPPASTTADRTNEATPTPTPTPTPTSAGSASPMAELPNGLVPAHDDVWFDDSEACRALEVGSVVGRGTDGQPAGFLEGEPWQFPVTGCVDGMAGFLMSDRWFFDSGIDDAALGILVARWQDGTWVLEGARKDADGTETVAVYDSWPMLGSFHLPGDPTPEQRMADQYAALEVDEVTGERLLGPEAVTWTFPTAAQEWTPGSAGSASFLWRGDGTRGHRAYSSDGTLPTTTGQDTSMEAVEFFDPRSKRVATLMVSGKEEGLGCEVTGTRYRLEGQAPTSLESADGPLTVALVTAPEIAGPEASTVMLVPASAPETGEWCDLPAEHRVGDVVVRFSGVAYQFRSEAERADYLASQEFADVTRLASSITID
jgi:hypothetical protein